MLMIFSSDDDFWDSEVDFPPISARSTHVWQALNFRSIFPLFLTRFSASKSLFFGGHETPLFFRCSGVIFLWEKPFSAQGLDLSSCIVYVGGDFGRFSGGFPHTFSGH